MSLGASIAFFTVFSLAPMLLAAIAVAGLVFGREAAQGAIVAELGSLVGETGAKAIEAMIASASNIGSDRQRQQHRFGPYWDYNGHHHLCARFNRSLCRAAGRPQPDLESQTARNRRRCHLLAHAAPQPRSRRGHWVSAARLPGPG